MKDAEKIRQLIIELERANDNADPEAIGGTLSDMKKALKMDEIPKRTRVAMAGTPVVTGEVGGAVKTKRVYKTKKVPVTHSYNCSGCGLANVVDMHRISKLGGKPDMRSERMKFLTKVNRLPGMEAYDRRDLLALSNKLMAIEDIKESILQGGSERDARKAKKMAKEMKIAKKTKKVKK